MGHLREQHVLNIFDILAQAHGFPSVLQKTYQRKLIALSHIGRRDSKKEKKKKEKVYKAEQS